MKNRHFRSIGALLIVVAMLVGMIGTTGVVWAIGIVLTYDSNDGGTAPDAVTIATASNITLAGVGSMTKEGYTFQGWATTKTATDVEYHAGDSYNLSEAKTLYAVWKANIDPEVKRETVKLHKFVVADPSVTLPVQNFSYSIVKYGLGDDATEATKAEMPTLTITSTSATTNANTKADGVYYRNGQHHNTAEAGNALTLTFTYNTDATQPTKGYDISSATGVKWPHAGVYRYIVSEVVPDPKPADWTYNTDFTEGDPAAVEKTGALTTKQNAYEILVYVENTDTGLDVTYVEVDSVTADSLAAPTTLENVAKVDASEGSSTNTDGSSLEFTNTYDPKVNLVISKTITGNAADMTKRFTYTVTSLKIPSGTGSYKDITNDATNGFNAVSSNAEAGNPTSAIGETSTFTLGNNETFTIKDLPVGTTYTITETGVTNYTATYKVTEKGVALTAETGTKNAAVMPEGTIKLDESIVNTTNEDLQNKVDYTNRYEVSTPTGIILSNLPAFAAIFCALGLAVFALIARRRRSR
ncbi:MAG TPA: InlB B-repeat-containing protein [Lachnospiraceae bacterium]|nr:InlB B-repeat-containing protein [Lachnospiraceae bacterium]